MSNLALTLSLTPPDLAPGDNLHNGIEKSDVQHTTLYVRTQLDPV